MILIDQNEPVEIDWYLQGLETQRGSYNQTGGSPMIYPDYTIVGGDKLVGVSRKQVGEVLSSLDKCEEQLQRELTGPCEWLVLLIEGVMRANGDSGMLAYQFDFKNEKVWKGGNANEAGQVPFHSRHFSVNPKHVQNWQTRLEFKGIQVVHTYSLQDSAMKLISLHELVMKNEPNRVLEKLIKPQVYVNASPEEKALATSLMGIYGAGIGEQLALTLAASFSTIGELMDYWSQGSSVQDTMLISGTRRVGHAAEAKLQRALGWHPSGNANLQGTEPAIEQDTALSSLPTA